MRTSSAVYSLRLVRDRTVRYSVAVVGVLALLWCVTFVVLRWNADRAQARRVQVIRQHAGLRPGRYP